MSYVPCVRHPVETCLLRASRDVHVACYKPLALKASLPGLVVAATHPEVYLFCVWGIALAVIWDKMYTCVCIISSPALYCGILLRLHRSFAAKYRIR